MQDSSDTVELPDYPQWRGVSVFEASEQKSLLLALLAAATLCVGDAASQDSDIVEGKPRTDAAQADGADCRQTLAFDRLLEQV